MFGWQLCRPCCVLWLSMKYKHALNEQMTSLVAFAKVSCITTHGGVIVFLSLKIVCVCPEVVFCVLYFFSFH